MQTPGASRDRLVADLTTRGRLEWAAEECEEQRVRSLHVRDPEQAWLRCKEARSLTGRSAAVARATQAGMRRANSPNCHGPVM